MMRYPTLKAQSPSPARAALLTATALAFFTLASGLVGSGPLAFADGQAHNPRTVQRAVARAGATVEPAGSVRENAAQAAVIAPPVSSLDASRAQEPPQGQTAQRARDSVIATAATAASGAEANPGPAEPASPKSSSSCLSVKCTITCDNGLSSTLDLADAAACFSYSDRVCHSSGFYVCSDKPVAPGC